MFTHAEQNHLTVFTQNLLRAFNLSTPSPVSSLPPASPTFDDDYEATSPVHEIDVLADASPDIDTVCDIGDSRSSAPMSTAQKLKNRLHWMRSAPSIAFGSVSSKQNLSSSSLSGVPVGAAEAATATHDKSAAHDIDHVLLVGGDEKQQQA